MATMKRGNGRGTLFKRTERGCWIASWYSHDGRRQTQSTRTSDKAAAERILGKYTGDTALRRAGVVDAATDRYAEQNRRLVAQHVDDWLATLSAKGVTAKQVDTLRARVTTLLETAKVERLAALTASGIQTALGDLRDKGRSLQTLQHYVRAVKQFSRWLRRDGRLRDDPLTALAGYNAREDRRHERRALSADELGRLVAAAQDGPELYGMGGPDRAMLY